MPLYHHRAPSRVSSKHSRKLTTVRSPNVPPPAFLRSEAVCCLAHCQHLRTATSPHPADPSRPQDRRVREPLRVQGYVCVAPWVSLALKASRR